MIEMAGRKSDAPARLWMRKTTQAAGGNARTAASGSERAGEPPSIRWERRRIVARQMTQIELLQHTGFRRVGSPKNGFRFVGAPRREVPRLRSLRIPPAWTDVAVSPSPRARRLARAVTLHRRSAPGRARAPGKTKGRPFAGSGPREP